MDFQEERCNRGSNCLFRHEKLSQADKAKLLAWLQERGKMNRHSDARRQEQGGGKSVRFATSVNASAAAALNPVEDTTISMLREATSSFSDEQVVLLAKHFANLSKADEEKPDTAKAGSSE